MRGFSNQKKKDTKAKLRETVIKTCGLMDDRCQGLAGDPAAWEKCGVALLCGLHENIDGCHSEDGRTCKEILNMTWTRRPCYWSSTQSEFKERAEGHCQLREGWGENGGSQSPERAQNGLGLVAWILS